MSVELSFSSNESSEKEYIDLLIGSGINRTDAIPYAKGILAVQEELEQLSKSTQKELLDVLIVSANQWPRKSRQILEVFQSRVMQALKEPEASFR
jgi:DNA repair protein RadC